MPGLSAIVSCDTVSPTRLSESYRDLEYRDGFGVRELLSSRNIAISFSGYNGYPSYCFEDENLLILVEGLIYNVTDTRIQSQLLEISQLCIEHRDYKSKITEFITGSDGDFLVLLYLKKDGRTFVFNDRWGRLPTFLFEEERMFAFSRELKFLLHWISSIEFDHFAINEFLMLGYSLGDKTPVEGIRRMRPASLLQLSWTKDQMDFIEDVLLPINFDTIDLGLTKHQIVEKSVELYRLALKTRLEKLREKGYGLIADVSGGFDTRAVFVGLSNENAHFTAINDVHVDSDQSNIALKLARLFGRDLVVCFTLNTVEDFAAMREATYLNDMVSNCRIAFRDQLTDAEREKIGFNGPIARFMGMGAGDFMRRPYQLKRPYHTFAGLLAGGAYNGMHCIPPSYACSIMRLRADEFLANLESELRQYPERNDEGKIKHLYFEYYNKSVNGGENRHRMFNWTVTPLWSKDLLSLEAVNLPLKYVGVRLHIDFMNALDGRALMVPIKGGHVRLSSLLGRLFYDVRLGLGRKLQYNTYCFKAYVLLINLLWRCKKSDSKYARLVAEASKVGERIGAAFDCVDRVAVDGFLKSSPRPTQVYQLLTVLFYLEEIERRFGNKIVPCRHSSTHAE
jgi:asparagine synthase (glutamine-hydrolysing)